MPIGLRDDIVDVIILETVRSIPNETLSFYRNLPGRRPSDLSKRVAASLREMPDDAARELIADIVDSAVFSLLYLLDNDFKSSIRVELKRGAQTCRPSDFPLLEAYRQRVDPGGVVIAQGGKGEDCL